MRKLKIYVASSWRNHYQPVVVTALRALGYEVHDFRPEQGVVPSFYWDRIDPEWQAWTPDQNKSALNHPLAQTEFHNEFKAIIEADICVLVLPCGRSSNTIAGYMKGSGKKVYALQMDNQAPELMYNLYDGIVTTPAELDELFKLENDKVFEVTIGRYTVNETASSHKEAANKVSMRYPTASLTLVNDYDTIHEVMGHCEVSGDPIFENDDYKTNGEGEMWLSIHNDQVINNAVDYFLNNWLVEHFPSDVKGDDEHNKVLFAVYWALMKVVNNGDIEGVVSPQEDPELGWNNVITATIRAEFAQMDEELKGKALTAVSEYFEEL